MKRPTRTIFLCLLLASMGTSAFAITKLPFPASVFELEGRQAFVMAPEQPAEGRPWVWYAPTLQNLPDASHTYYFEPLLKQGVAVAGYDLGEVRGAAKSSRQFLRFYEAMVEKGYSKKPVLLGQSRGGLMLLCWAYRHPDKVQAFAGIYPVCNIASWPLKYTKAAVLLDYGMSEDKLLKQLESLNPAGNLEGLAKNKVPMFMVHGDADDRVPLEDNSALIQEAYEKSGGTIDVKVIPGEGHNMSPAFFKNPDLLEFLQRQTKGPYL